VGPAIAATLPAALQELLGFNQASDFFGFIAGQAPRNWLAAVTKPDGDTAKTSRLQAR